MKYFGGKHQRAAAEAEVVLLEKAWCARCEEKAVATTALTLALVPILSIPKPAPHALARRIHVSADRHAIGVQGSVSAEVEAANGGQMLEELARTRVRKVLRAREIACKRRIRR